MQKYSQGSNKRNLNTTQLSKRANHTKSTATTMVTPSIEIVSVVTTHSDRPIGRVQAQQSLLRKTPCIFSYYKAAKKGEKKYLTNTEPQGINENMLDNLVIKDTLVEKSTNVFDNKQLYSDNSVVMRNIDLTFMTNNHNSNNLNTDAAHLVAIESYKNNMLSQTNSQNNQTIQRFVNFLTKKGKKSIAKSVLLKTLYLLNKKQKFLQNEVEQQEFRMISTGKSKLNFEVQNNRDSYAVQTKPSISPLAIVHTAINQVKPLFEVKKIRVAGATYQVPSLVKSCRQKNIGINWLIKSALERKKKTFSHNNFTNKLDKNLEGSLALEIFEAFQKQGQARNKRNELHKLAEQNRAFSHFRWW